MYDAVVIGAGPAGYVCAIRTAQLGGKVVLIEKDKFGGTCTNWGCIPTKALIASLEILEKTKKAKRFGINIENVTVDFSVMQKRKNMVVKTLSMGIERLLIANGVELISGVANIVDKKTVAVADKKLETKNIVIATGSVPMIPGFIKVGERVITSKELLDISEIPKSLVIIGGGFIGVEFATIFSKLGTKVTLLEMLPNLISTEDVEVSEAIENILRKDDVTIFTGTAVKEVKEEADKVVITAGDYTIEAEYALVAIGRKSLFNPVEMDKLGVKYEKNGILVDAKMKTNINNIYAIGDVNINMQLAHVASHEAIVAADNIMGKEAEMSYDKVPNCIFTIPAIASVGKRTGRYGKYPFAALGRARVTNELDGFLKIYFEDEKVVGASIIGAPAAEIIGELGALIGTDYKEASLEIHAHPTYSEIITEALMAYKNESVHFKK